MLTFVFNPQRLEEIGKLTLNRLGGKLFHVPGSVPEKALFPNVIIVRETSNVPDVDNRCAARQDRNLG